MTIASLYSGNQLCEIWDSGSGVGHGSCPLNGLSAMWGLPEDATRVLDHLDALVFIFDPGKIVWVNRAAELASGWSATELQGRHLGELLTEGGAVVADVHFRRKTEGPGQEGLVDREGTRVRVKAFSFPLKQEGQVVGVLALAVPVGPDSRGDVGAWRWPSLTPRQSEVLGLLCAGLSTREIALRLRVSHQTTRNHISGVLRALNARSRSEAVVIAHRLGLVSETQAS